MSVVGLLLHLILGTLSVTAFAWTFGRTLAASAESRRRASSPVRVAIAARWPSWPTERPVQQPAPLIHD